MQPTQTAPQLPPIQRQAETASPPPPPAAPTRAGPTGVQRLRQAAGYVLGGSFILVLLICLAQLVLKPGLTPADLMATIEAQTDIGIFNQKMGYKRGEHVLNEAQYQEALALAQRQGAAKAELAFPTRLAALQADKERVVGAYQTLYQRANQIAEAGLQMENVAQQFRQRLLEMAGGGRNVVIMIKDFACGLGDAEACASARKDREVMISESDELSRGDVGAKIRALMADIDDPATLVAREDQRRNGTPSVQR